MPTRSKKGRPAGVEEAPPLPDVPLQIECLYTPEEAGRYLRMSERAVRRRLDVGALGYVDIGHKRYVRGDQVLAYMEDKRVDPRPAHLRPALRDR